MAKHWTAEELLPVLRDFVAEGRLQVEAAAKRCIELAPGRLRPWAMQAHKAVDNLDQELHGLLYTEDPGQRLEDARRLRDLWLTAATAQRQPPAGVPEPASESEDSTESSELSPSSTPEGVALANALAASQAAQRAARAPPRPGLCANAKRTAKKALKAAAKAAATAEVAATAEDGGAASSSSAAKGKAKGKAKAKGRPKAEPATARARGAAAARDSRTEAMSTWHDFRAEQTPKFSHLGRQEALKAISAAWREHQATALGKPYGCPKCTWNGCSKCGRWPPHKRPAPTPEA